MLEYIRNRLNSLRKKSRNKKPEKKNILIASGGTRVPIDSVRHIGNMATGRLGADLAKAALLEEQRVMFLHSRGSCHPFELKLDAATDYKVFEKQLLESELEYDVLQSHRSFFSCHKFATYNQYYNLLEQELISNLYDYVFLPVAVSDFGLLFDSKVNTKISSDTEGLQLHLQRLPKIINKVKQEWSPDSIVVGFKLLVDANDSDLIQAAKKQIELAGSDIVIANDLTKVKHGIPQEVKIVTQTQVSTISKSIVDDIPGCIMTMILSGAV